MGLIRAAVSAVGSTLADSWLELFYTDSLDNDTLMVKGSIRTKGRHSNRFGNDNIISNGSGLLVNDGQCAIIVDQGRIVELCAEPGYYTYDTSSEPTIFRGNLPDSVQAMFETMMSRFTYGGDAAKDQRVYFFNTKEIVGNKFGTMNPIPFRVVDKAVGFDIDLSLRCSGTYTFRIVDPLVLYKNIAGNVQSKYSVSDISNQLRMEFVNALVPAVGRLSELELRPSDLPMHVNELCDYMNEALDAKWHKTRGIEVTEISLNPITLTEEDQELLKNAQKAKLTANAKMAAAQMAAAQADALRTAAGNSGSAMQGFVGMNMATSAGGAEALFAQAAAEEAAGEVKFCPACGAKADISANFCTKCGTKL